MEDVALSYHPTTFGNNCETQCGNMGKTVENLLTGGHKPASSLKMDLDGELMSEYNYKRRLFTSTIHLMHATL